MGAPSAPDDTAYDGSINTEPEPSVSFETAPSTAVEHHHTNPTPNSEYDSELSDAGDETETELDDAFDDANYSDESIPTFSSSKMIAECDDVVRVAAFPTPPVVEEGGRDRGRLGGGYSTAASLAEGQGGFVRE